MTHVKGTVPHSMDDSKVALACSGAASHLVSARPGGMGSSFPRVAMHEPALPWLPCVPVGPVTPAKQMADERLLQSTGMATWRLLPSRRMQKVSQP